MIPENWLRECRSADERLVNAFSAGAYADTAPGGAYHNFWWLNKPPMGAIMALGVSGQVLYIDTEKNFVAAKLSSQPDYENVKLEDFSYLDNYDKYFLTNLESAYDQVINNW